jgi:hypothetical protein
MSKNLAYPEMQEYDWALELEQLTKRSKATSGSMMASERKRAPLKLVQKMLKDGLEKDGVLEAYSKIAKNCDNLQRELHLATWFNEYLRHKYGNQTKANRIFINYMKELAVGDFDGVDDPMLVKKLKEDPRVLLEKGARSA